MPVINKQDLVNAKLDADDISSFVSDAPAMVTPRFGADYPNIRLLIEKVLNGEIAASNLSAIITPYVNQSMQSSAIAVAAASTAESVVGPTYASVAAGQAATTTGQSFAVDNGNGTVSIYLRTGGGSTLQRTLATTAALFAQGGGSLVTVTPNQTNAVPRTLIQFLSENMALSPHMFAPSGFAMDGSADWSPYVTACATACKLTGKAFFWLQTGTGYAKLNNAVDLTGILNINVQAKILVSTAIVAVPIEVGGFAQNGTQCEISFQAVTDGSNAFTSVPSRPLLRAIGVKGGNFSLADCNYVQFYAATGRGSAFASTAQLRVHSNGVWGLIEITDDGTAGSYVNENTFYHMRPVRVRIKGVGYNHNHNRFHDVDIEGSAAWMEFTNCSSNTFTGVRAEGMSAGLGYSFAADTYSNRIVHSWNGGGHTQDDFRIQVPITNLGVGNVVTTEAATFYNKRRLTAITPRSVIATATDRCAYDSGVAPMAFGLFAGTRAVIDPGLTDFGFDANKLIIATARMPVVNGTAFYIDPDYDGNLIRPYVVALDVFGQPFTTEGGNGPFVTFLNMGAFNAAHGSYTTGSNLSAAILGNSPIVVRRNDVGFLRIGLYSSVAGRARALAISTWQNKLLNGKLEASADVVPMMLSLDAKPSRGFLPIRACVRDRVANTFYDNDLEYETTVSGALAAGVSSITVTAAGTTANDDIMGVTMDNGSIHWAKIAAKSGNTFNMVDEANAAKPIPVGRSVINGARIVFNRWA